MILLLGSNYWPPSPWKISINANLKITTQEKRVSLTYPSTRRPQGSTLPSSTTAVFARSVAFWCSRANEVSGSLVVMPAPGSVQLWARQPLCWRKDISTLCTARPAPGASHLVSRARCSWSYPSYKSYFYWDFNQGNQIRNGFRNPGLAKQNHCLFHFPLMCIHSHTPGIVTSLFSTVCIKELLYPPFWSVGHWGSDGRIQTLKTVSPSPLRQLHHIDPR